MEVEEEDVGMGAVVEIVKLVGEVLPVVCIGVVVEISVVVTTEVSAEDIVIVVGGGTETIVVVNEEGGCVDFEESDDFFLPLSLSLSDNIRRRTSKATLCRF